MGFLKKLKKVIKKIDPIGSKIHEKTGGKVQQAVAKATSGGVLGKLAKLDPEMSAVRRSSLGQALRSGVEPMRRPAAPPVAPPVAPAAMGAPAPAMAAPPVPMSAPVMAPPMGGVMPPAGPMGGAAPRAQALRGMGGGMGMGRMRRPGY